MDVHLSWNLSKFQIFYPRNNNMNIMQRPSLQCQLKLQFFCRLHNMLSTTPFAFEIATEEQISMGNKKTPPTCILLVSVKYILWSIHPHMLKCRVTTYSKARSLQQLNLAPIFVCSKGIASMLKLQSMFIDSPVTLLSYNHQS